jgi:hypothetical protein
MELYSGSLEITQRDKFVEKGDGKIFLALYHKPRIEFELYTDTVDPPISYGEVSLNLQEFGISVRSFVTELPKNLDQNKSPLWIGGMVGQPIIIESEEALKLVQFHLINFNAKSSFTLEAEGWSISVSPLQNFNNTSEQLKLTKGFALTHTGTLERSDGNTFSSQQAKEMLRILFYILSFARGLWVSPILPVGLDNAGVQVWKFWYPYKTGAWEAVNSWFIELMPDMLFFVFPGFLQRWQNPIWLDTMRLVIDWYIESNTQNTETSLIVNQAAFELLSWVLLVEDKAILSKEGFDKLFASDKLRLLLSQAGIPLLIDPRQVKLTKLAQDAKWQDGPHALTEMRNKMVHPKLTDPKITNQPKRIKNILGYPIAARAEAGQLGLWYLEKILLWLFGYNGEIENGRLMNRYFD